MVLILSVLLYVIIAELVTTARMARFTGENDVLLARMRNHMRYTLAEVEDMLIDDKPAEGGGAGGPGGLAPGGAPPEAAAGGEGAGGQQSEEDLAGTADGSQDAWYEPQGYSDSDITTYVWVEDENRKFDILSLVSSDEEFARESRRRFVRLIDYLREDSPMDLNSGDGERLASQIVEWMRGQARTVQMPRPPLKSDGTQSDVTLMLHLDELRMFEGVTDELFYDQVVDNRLMLGLESVLTVSTSWVTDPGDPDKLAARGQGNPAGGPGAAAGNPGAGGQSGQGNPASGSPNGSPSGSQNEQEPIGEGIRININTASRPVLRCLFPENEMPPAVIEAILRYRNEELPPSEEGTAESQMVSEGDRPKRKMFGEVSDLDKVPEFMNLGSPAIKEKLYALTTTHSDVFTVHMASMFKRNEENRVFRLRRSASMLVRLQDGEEARLHPIFLLEDRSGLRVMPIDFQDRYEDQLRRDDYSDQFAREERAWNPFLLEFYRPRQG